MAINSLGKAYSPTVKKYLFMLELRGVAPTLLNLIKSSKLDNGRCKSFYDNLISYLNEEVIREPADGEDILLIQVLSLIIRMKPERFRCKNLRVLLWCLIDELIHDYQFNLEVYSLIKPFLENLAEISEALESVRGLK